MFNALYIMSQEVNVSGLKSMSYYQCIPRLLFFQKVVVSYKITCSDWI